MSTLRCAGAPSSSIAHAPHSRASVPSSTRVTSGDATCSPARPRNTDESFADEVGLEAVPAGLVEEDPAGAALQHDRELAGRRGPGPAACVSARRAEVRATSSGSISSKSSKPTVRPGRLHARSACRCRRRRRTGRRSGCAPGRPARAARRSWPRGSAVASRRTTRSPDGWRRPRTGRRRRPARGARPCAPSRPTPAAPAPRAVASTSRRVERRPRACRSSWLRVAAAAASAASSRALRTGRRCARTRWSRPRTTRMPAPRSRPDVSSSTLPSSRRADEARRSSTKTSAKSPPPSQGGVQRAFEDTFVDHRYLRSGRCPRRPATLRRCPGARTGGDRRDDRGRRRHRARAAQRRRARARDAARRVPRRGGDGARGRRPARGRAPRASATGCSSTTSPRPRWAARVTAEAVLEAVEGRRLTFRVSVSDGHGLVAAGPDHPGRGRARPRSSRRPPGSSRPAQADATPPPAPSAPWPTPPGWQAPPPPTRPRVAGGWIWVLVGSLHRDRRARGRERRGSRVEGEADRSTPPTTTSAPLARHDYDDARSRSCAADRTESHWSRSRRERELQRPAAPQPRRLAASRPSTSNRDGETASVEVDRRSRRQRRARHPHARAGRDRRRVAAVRRHLRVQARARSTRSEPTASAEVARARVGVGRVGEHVHERRPGGRERAVERRAELARFGHELAVATQRVEHLVVARARAGARRRRRSRRSICIGCFSRPQMPLLPTIVTTSTPNRTSVSRSPSEKPIAPSPSMHHDLAVRVRERRPRARSPGPCRGSRTGPGSRKHAGLVAVDVLARVRHEVAAVADDDRVAVERGAELAVDARAALIGDGRRSRARRPPLARRACSSSRSASTHARGPARRSGRSRIGERTSNVRARSPAVDRGQVDVAGDARPGESPRCTTGASPKRPKPSRKSSGVPATSTRSAPRNATERARENASSWSAGSEPAAHPVGEDGQLRRLGERRAAAPRRRPSTRRRRP